jgi:hypothetical protein
MRGRYTQRLIESTWAGGKLIPQPRLQLLLDLFLLLFRQHLPFQHQILIDKTQRQAVPSIPRLAQYGYSSTQSLSFQILHLDCHGKTLPKHSSPPLSHHLRHNAHLIQSHNPRPHYNHPYTMTTQPAKQPTVYHTTESSPPSHAPSLTHSPHPLQKSHPQPHPPPTPKAKLARTQPAIGSTHPSSNSSPPYYANTTHPPSLAPPSAPPPPLSQPQPQPQPPPSPTPSPP